MRRLRERGTTWATWAFTLVMANLLLTGLLTSIIPQTTYLTAPLVCPAQTRMEHDWIGSSNSKSGPSLNVFCVDSDGRRSENVQPLSFLIIYLALLLLWALAICVLRLRRSGAARSPTSAT